jgi:hypothetical protein
LAAGSFLFGVEAQQPSAGAPVPSAAHRDVINRYCVSCHNGRLKTGGLALDTVVAADVAQNQEAWEKAIRKMRARQMPPVGLPRPDDATYQATIASLERSLDRAAVAHPNPGRTDTLRRLNRTEYRNAIRDLLALDVDVASLLPADESSYGFDNVTVADLADLAGSLYFSGGEDQPFGGRTSGPFSRRRYDQDSAGPYSRGAPGRSPGRHPRRRGRPIYLPARCDASSGRLARDRNEHVEGLTEPHEVELLLDRERVQLFTIAPPARQEGFEDYQPSHDNIDRHLTVRVPVKAGPHALGVAFLKTPPRCSKPRVNRTRRTSISTGIRGSSRPSTPFRSSVPTRRKVPARRRAARGCLCRSRRAPPTRNPPPNASSRR